LKFMPKTAWALLLSATTVSAHAQVPANPQRLDEVAERGKHVMPFHLEKTRHVFNKTERGGLQQVIAKNASDGEQIHLIRQHLSQISERFKKSDFSRQRQIHGDDMPGLAELSSHHQQVTFDYRELPNGAEIEYSTNDATLVDAIHRYFDAQLSDHARHAVGGHGMHHQHQQ